MSVKAYKLLKLLTQLAGIGAGIYAMILGADPMTTFALIATIISGPEAVELLLANADVQDSLDQRRRE